MMSGEGPVAGLGSYPSAPLGVDERRAYFADRNRRIQEAGIKPPVSGSFGGKAKGEK